MKIKSILVKVLGFATLTVEGNKEEMESTIEGINKAIQEYDLVLYRKNKMDIERIERLQKGEG